MDPECPEFQELEADLHSGLDDPMTGYYGAQDVIAEDYEKSCRKHRLNCMRCLQYGLSNLEIVENE
jgi:hypothetical protein